MRTAAVRYVQGEGTSWRGLAIRVLVALEHSYRTYRDVIAAAIQISRPDVEVESAELDALNEKVRSFRPHLVICSLPVTANLEDVPGWVELSLDLSRPSVVSIRARSVEQASHMRMEQLLDVIDEVERRTLRD